MNSLDVKLTIPKLLISSMGCASSQVTEIPCYTLNGQPIKDAKWTKHSNTYFPIEILIMILEYANIQCLNRNKDVYSLKDAIIICGSCRQCKSYQLLYELLPNFNYGLYLEYISSRDLAQYNHLPDFDVLLLSNIEELSVLIRFVDECCGEHNKFEKKTTNYIEQIRRMESICVSQIRGWLQFRSDLKNDPIPEQKIVGNLKEIKLNQIDDDDSDKIDDDDSDKIDDDDSDKSDDDDSDKSDDESIERCKHRDCCKYCARCKRRDHCDYHEPYKHCNCCKYRKYHKRRKNR